jgi:hypothetical protein
MAVFAFVGFAGCGSRGGSTVDAGGPGGATDAADTAGMPDSAREVSGADGSTVLRGGSEAPPAGYAAAAKLPVSNAGSTSDRRTRMPCRTLRRLGHGPAPTALSSMPVLASGFWVTRPSCGLLRRR